MEAMSNHCLNQNQTDTCTKDLGGKCHKDIDGFYIEVFVNTVYGIFWWFWARKMFDRIQNLPSSEWHILSRKNENNKNELYNETKPV